MFGRKQAKKINDFECNADTIVMNPSSIGTPTSFSTPDILSNYNRRQVVVSIVIQENQVAVDIQKGNLHTDEQSN